MSNNNQIHQHLPQWRSSNEGRNNRYSNHPRSSSSSRECGNKTSETPSWEVKLVDEYLHNLAQEQLRKHHQQQSRYSRDNSTRSMSSRTSDPASEEFDLDDSSMPDSVNVGVHCQNRNSDDCVSLRSRPAYDTCMILEDEPYLSSYAGSMRLGSKRWNRTSSRVQFAEDALLYSCNYSYEEVLRTWYNRDELSSFKQERKEIVKVLKKFNFNLPEIEKTHGRKYCFRGYEPYFSIEGNKEIRRNRECVLSTVLKEQSRQLSLSSKCESNPGKPAIDHKVLAKYAADASKWARDCATRLGVQDANEVLKEYGQDIKSRDPHHLWQRMIDKAIEEASEYQEEEYLKQAMMEFDLMEQQAQSAAQEQERPRSPIQRSSSNELLRLQREQLVILQEYQRQQQQQRPNLDQRHTYGQERVVHRDEQLYQMHQDQLIALQQEQELRALQEQQQRFELDRQREIQQQQWLNEQELLQQERIMQDQQDRERLHHIQEAERQQMLRLQQMELEQQRQQEQLRQLMEEQMRMEQMIRSQRLAGGRNAEDIDEELEQALKLVEALNVHNQAN